MLTNFHFSLYRFTYVVKEPLTMPDYKGNIFRSRLGYFLRQIACLNTTDGQSCEKQCLSPHQCLYSRIFETPVSADSPVLKGQTFAPHPFVLEPPLTTKTRYEPGETFACHLLLLGNAIETLPWLVYTFDELGRRRIGVKGQRGRCQLELVECLPSLDSEMSQTVYTGVSKTMRDTYLPLTFDDVLKNAPSVSDTLELDFLTPTRIKVGGKIATELTFETLVRNLFRRIHNLSYFHCGEPLELDFTDLCEKASAVKTESELRWEAGGRWSYRANTRVPMGGFVGRIRFEGKLEAFLPFIFLGEYLHIGHNTAFGFGKYYVYR